MKAVCMKNLIIVIVLLVSVNVYGQNTNDAPLSKNAPTDRPAVVNGLEQLEEYLELIAPYVEKAQKTLPGAKETFLNGLEDGQAFFLTTVIYDKQGNYEQIFVRVKSWDNEDISGTIANQLYGVKGYEFKQLITFSESDILDWTITNSDGSEEGNFVGKFIETLR